MDDSDAASHESGEYSVRITKVPPIVVDSDLNFNKIIELLGQKCKYKRMSIGTKIMPNTLVDYGEIMNIFKSKNITFFTHPIKDNQKFKLVLFGLPQISTEAINEEFKEKFNIEPLSVEEIKTARSTVDDALYMLEFNKNQISKREIMKIKYFCGIVVQWRNPLRSKKGPTQCSKCAMYGHGAANCHRKVACLGCGGPHDYSVCTLDKVPNNGPVIYKCYNCIKNKRKNVNHRADDSRCPFRREYLEIRQRITSKRPQMRYQRERLPDDDFSEYETTITNKGIPTPGTNFNKVTYANMVKSRQQGEDNDISNEKILEIYFEALDALQKCQNKYDKMRVLGMMLKHVI